MKKLGFGLMRLPKKGPFTDIEQVKDMVDMFLDAGFTYFDTAHTYLGSEAAAKKALVSRHPRDSYTLATKLNVNVAPTKKAAEKQLETSLARTGAGYFDYYLLHAIMDDNYDKYVKFGLWDFAASQKQKGILKNIGFSFHSGPDLLDRILNEHPEVDFVQLQINYADWENPSVLSRANYEVARKHSKDIIVMEPVKGGSLANPQPEVQKLFKECNPDMSCASWGIRFAASLPGVLTVLSGMSNTQQMQDNLSYMKDFKPLEKKEQNVIQQVQQILGNSAAIACTACSYCIAGCPENIPIPDIFASANKHLSNGQTEEAKKSYAEAVSNRGKASDCIECKQCERVCPQHLKITEHLKQCAELLEK